MAQLHEYECPKCGGGLEFDSSIQMLRCPYCDSQYTIEEVQNVDEILDNPGVEQNLPEQPADSIESADGLITYLCKSCGGEIIGTATLAASACPFCGNPIVMMGQFTGKLKPDYIIPFKLDKNAAKDALRKHLEGKKLLPKVFKDENNIDEIKGIYVPFWFYDTVADADLSFDASKTKIYDDEEYSYMDVTKYSLLRKGKIIFENVPVDASEAIDNSLMESIEPYDFNDAVDFHTGYLAGYLADKFDVNAAECLKRAGERIDNSTVSAFQNLLGDFDDISVSKSDVSLRDTKAKYALCPIWLLNTSWKGEKFTFAMNGQTGRFVGNLPMDRGAFKRYFFAIGSAAAVIVYLFLTFFLS